MAKTFKKFGRVFSSKESMEGFEAIREALEQANEGASLADGFEDALVGLADRFGMDTVALYDREKVIEILMTEGLTEEDAEEHFSFNIIGSGVEHAPIFATIMRKK